MLGTGSVETSEELAVLVRNDFIESRHAGSVVVLSPAGKVLFSKGDPDALIFPRSTMKLFQAIGMMSLGLDLEGKYLALSAASHNGSAAHIELVREVLAKGSFTDEDLRGGSDLPGDRAMLAQVFKADGKAMPIYHCCSGKHAAMLLLCNENGWPTETYLDPSHPLQIRIREVVEYLTDSKIPSTGIDGCGAPVFAMSLLGLAKGISRIASAEESDSFDLKKNGAKLLKAMVAYPEVVGAPGESDTVIMQKLGFLAKTGYEGVFIALLSDGTAVATKVLDGNLRAAAAITLQALVRAGVLEQSKFDELLPLLHMDVTGGGKVVGRLETTF